MWILEELGHGVSDRLWRARTLSAHSPYQTLVHESSVNGIDELLYEGGVRPALLVSYSAEVILLIPEESPRSAFIPQPGALDEVNDGFLGVGPHKSQA